MFYVIQALIDHFGVSQDKREDGIVTEDAIKEGIETLSVPANDHSISNIVVKSFLR